jgi:hypothetical protein
LSAARVNLTVKNGIVLVGSDGHYWPGKASTAHRAFVQFCKKLKPVAVIMNGDAFDGATVSRHAGGWEENPTVKQELDIVKERLGEIEAATPRSRLIWPWGNHDARYELRLATVAREYANVAGMHLKDHFPKWEPCWGVWINGEVVVKHRYKGGTHAAYNNALSSGKTMITGHQHAANVTRVSDYNGYRWGVDAGCLADPGGPQFGYTEDNPRNHHSGFAVLTFRDGELMWPEIVYVIADGKVGFRGEIINVSPSLRSANPQAPHRRRAARSTAQGRADTAPKKKAQAKVRTKARARAVHRVHSRMAEF